MVEILKLIGADIYLWEDFILWIQTFNAVE